MLILNICPKHRKSFEMGFMLSGELESCLNMIIKKTCQKVKPYFRRQTGEWRMVEDGGGW